MPACSYNFYHKFIIFILFSFFSQKKRALEVVLEETRAQSIMLQDNESKLQLSIKSLESKLDAMSERARVAENKTQEIGLLKSTIQSLNDEIQHKNMRENSLQV